MTNGIQVLGWYDALVSDCKAIVTERLYRSRQEIIEGWHEVGQRIATDQNYQKASKGNLKLRQKLAEDIGKSVQSLYFAIQFYEKFPVLSNALETFPEGKNISWYKITNKYLANGGDNPTQARRKLEAERLAKETGRFPVILADPAWEYDFSRSDSRRIENHYQPSSVDEMKELIPPATDDAVLFMCATSPKLREALELMEAWGFEYKTNMVWVKDRIGMGYYARQKHELVLIGTKGDGLELPDPSTRPESVFYAPRGEHSEKPEELYKIIEGMYPPYGKYEMFARKTRTGWKVWGDES